MIRITSRSAISETYVIWGRTYTRKSGYTELYTYLLQMKYGQVLNDRWSMEACNVYFPHFRVILRGGRRT